MKRSVPYVNSGISRKRGAGASTRCASQCAQRNPAIVSSVWEVGNRDGSQEQLARKERKYVARKCLVKSAKACCDRENRERVSVVGAWSTHRTNVKES